MHKKVMICCWIAILCTTAAALAASPAIGRGDAKAPHRYLPTSMDADLVRIAVPADGSTLAAWSYRNGAEYDIAVSVAGAGRGWSEPVLVGLDDGADQVQPTLATDGSTVYLAYADRASGCIMLSWLGADGTWAVPRPVTAAGRDLRSPTLRIVAGQRLIVAYIDGDRVELVDLGLSFADPDGTIGTHQIVDGPDPFGATGDDEDNRDDSGEEDSFNGENHDTAIGSLEYTGSTGSERGGSNR